MVMSTDVIPVHLCRELVMESEGMGKEEVCATISSLPSQLSSEDVEDFFSLAHYYATRTPQSFRKVHCSYLCASHMLSALSSQQDYHSLMFGSGRSVASLASNVSHALCLPISLQEVLDSNVTDSSTTEVCIVAILSVTGCKTLSMLACSCPGVQGSMRYFLVDCRPVDHFSCGHLAKSFHLDANLVFTFSSIHYLYPIIMPIHM